MALGFKLPEVKFLSITLDGGTDLLKKTDEPHTEQDGEKSFTGVISNTSDDLNQAPEPMKVDVILGIQVAFDITSSNIYSSFFKNDFAKYLKLRVVQSTNYLTTQTILSDPTAYLKTEEVIPPGTNSQYIDMSDFSGLQPELAPDNASSVEVKYDSSGNKIYIFPYPFQFEVPASQGGIKTDHLAYFTYAYIDIDTIVADEGLFGDIELPQEIVEKLSMGQVSTQTVIQNGTTNNFSQVFYTTPTDSDSNPTNFPDLRDENNNIIGKDYSQAQVWTGQFHYHGASNPGPNGYIGYMAALAGNNMGPFLTAVPIQNGIIQDFREIKELEKISFDYSLFSNSWFNQETTEKLQNNINGLKKLAGRDNPYLEDTDDIDMAIVKSLSNSKNKSVFGDFYSAMDGSGNTRYGFNINIKEAIKQNTVFPKLVDFLFETSDDSVDELLGQKLIKELKIYRHRVYEENPADPSVDIYEEVLNDHPKLVVATSESDDGLLLAKQEYSSDLEKVVGAIKQEDIHLTYNSNSGAESGSQTKKTKFYTGTDLQTPIDGDYIFSIELNIKDPIIGWMKNRIDELEAVLVEFRIYNSICQEDPEYYNNYTNRFSQKGIEKLTSQYSYESPLFIYNEIVKYFGILEKFSSFDELTHGAFSLLALISSANYGNPSGVQTTLRVMESIYSKILKVFSSASKYKKAIDSQHVESQYAAGSNPRRDFIIKHKFNTEIKGEIDHLTAYDYLSMQNTKDEDTPFASGLKSMSFAQYDTRVLYETNKLTSTGANSNSFPISIGGTNNIPVLNPSDSINFTKYAYLSPSLVNFSDSDSTNLLNNGTIVTDVTKLNNTLLNIVKYNTKSGQTLDFPMAPVATGVGNNLQDKIIPQSFDNELKYDLLNLMSLRQATVSSNEMPQPRKSTNAGGIVGGSTSTDMARLDSDALSTLYELPDSQKKYGLVDIFTSTNDPTGMLLAATEQNHFNILSDPKWTWEYYVEFGNFDFGVHKEYLLWNSVSTLNMDSPLKRAPNHVKFLMVLLGWKNNMGYPVPDAFEALKGYLKTNKPHAYNYDMLADGQLTLMHLSNFFGITSLGQELNGMISYGANMYPKNKVIYQTPEFLSFFLLNYKNIVKIEFLAGYKDDNINDPIWEELTNEFVEIFKFKDTFSGILAKNILCRMVPYEKQLYGVKRYDFMKLPVYNEHFIVRFDEQEGPDPIEIPDPPPEEPIPDSFLEEEIPLIGTPDALNVPGNINLQTVTLSTRAEDVNQLAGGSGGELIIAPDVINYNT